MPQKQPLSDFDEALCRRLHQSRKEANLSFKDLESLTGISRSTLQRYESGISTKITNSKLQIIAKALNVTPAYLMGWESKELPLKSYSSLLPLLDELGCTLQYNEETEQFSLIYNDFPIPITPEQIKELKNLTLSFLDYQLYTFLSPTTE